ncbi:MAG: DUF2807 domain-containing protein [Chloroflexi bacterium]|nr:DUF2807 domain-containing protein [Chloroflexota bacterium]
MKTNKLFLIAAVLFIFVMTMACGVTGLGRTIQGSGDIITEDRDVSGFDRVSLSGFGEVNIEIGDEESLTVTTDDNIMPYVRTEVKNNTLVIDFDDKGFNRGYDPTDGINFTLVVKDLNRINVSGAGKFFVDELETEKLVINNSGAASVEINDLKAEELIVTQSGAGTVFVSGKVQGQELSHSGAGSYHAGDLESETSIIEISGVGTATVWATESLDISISGLGNVIYYGNPRISQSISGLGNLISADK